MTAIANRPAALDATRPARRPLGALVRAYVALTKPRIIELLLVTTVPPMFLAAGGVPPWQLVAATLVAGTLAAGSANALNNYVDRDIDLLMRRTARRPLATAVLRPREALGFGTALGVVAILGMALLVNALAAGLTLFAILFYVLGYTLGLKRRTPQNIVWGGAAGCMPVLIGWAAVTGSLAWPAWVLFGVVFFWTPPHFWALAMRFRADYAAAGVPMLPVVATETQVARQIVAYSWLMVLTSLAIAPVAGWTYLAAALVVGALFLREAHRLAQAARGGEDGRPMRLFHWSTTYLTLLFVAVAVAPLLPPP